MGLGWNGKGIYSADTLAHKTSNIYSLSLSTITNDHQVGATGHPGDHRVRRLSGGGKNGRATDNHVIITITVMEKHRRCRAVWPRPLLGHHLHKCVYINRYVVHVVCTTRAKQMFRVRLQ